MRAVVLGRVSRGDKTQDPQTQVSALVAAADRKGWEVVETVVLVQSAWDAASAKEVMEKALRPIREGRADVLMVWSLDRVVRGGAEAAFAFIGQLERHLGARFFSLEEPYLCTAGDEMTRELILPLIAFVGKWESKRKSDRLKEKANYKKGQAEKLGQRARWGRGSMATGKDWGEVERLLGENVSQRVIAKEVGLSLGAVNAMCRKIREGRAAREFQGETVGGAGL